MLAQVLAREAIAGQATPEPAPIDCAGAPIVPTLEIVLAVGAAGDPIDSATFERARQVIARRAAALAGDACRIWSDGAGRILVQFAEPNAPDPDVARRALAGTGLLEIIDPDGQFLAAGTMIRTSFGEDSSGEGTAAAEPVYQSIVAGQDIADAYLTSNAFGQLVVGFVLSPEAADRFCKFTSDGIGRPLAIVLDKVVVSSPVVNSPICGGQGIVEGLTTGEAQALVVQLLSGALPTAIEVAGVYSLSAETGGAIPGVMVFGDLSTVHQSGPIDYDHLPPAGGLHNPVWQTCGFYDASIPNETAVHSLEHGAVWITYRPDLPGDQIERLRKLAEGQSHLLVSPFPDLRAPIVATAWGVQLDLDSVDDPRLVEFVSQYRQNPETAPEPGATCSNGYSGTLAEWLEANPPGTPAV
jgi:hypothetical protein